MSEGLSYRLQYQIIARTTQGEVEHVCFHGPGRMGFGDLEIARQIRDALIAADLELSQARNYEIIPMAVASDFDQMPTIEFETDDDELPRLFDNVPPESGPGSSSGLN